MDWNLLRVNQNGSQMSWFLDQSFCEMAVAITSSIMKANVPAMLSAVLFTGRVCSVCSEGGEPLFECW